MHEHLLHLTISVAVDPTFGYTYNALAGLLDDLMSLGELFKDFEVERLLERRRQQ